MLLMGLVATAACYCQAINITDSYNLDSIYRAGSENFISLVEFENNKVVRNVRYIKMKNLATAFVMKDDSTVEQKAVAKPDLFSIIEENYQSIRKLNKYLLKNRNEFQNFFSGPVSSKAYVGIKYKQVFNGHFPVLTEQDCDRLNLIALKNSFSVIENIKNILTAIATQAPVSGAPEN